MAILNPKFDELTSLELLEKIKEYEKMGKFDEHLDPINPDYTKVDENFMYIPDEALAAHYKEIEKKYIIPYTWLLNKILVKTKVKGKKNIKGIDKAIVTCNHINKADCICLRYAFKGHPLYTVGAPFNNQNGMVGEFMRAGKMLPLAEDYKGMKHFNEALQYYINEGSYISFYPETSEWWCYEKPRPYANGAFHYAIKFNVPVIPVFITFKDRKFAKDKFGLPKKQFIVNILEPIYPDPNLDKNQNLEMMKNKNFAMCKAKYEEFYGKKLTYTCDEEVGA